MIEISVESEHNLVTFKNMGTRTSATVEAGFRTVKGQYEKHGPVRLLIDWTEMGGIDEPVPNMAMRAVQASVMVECVAFIIDPKWEAEAAFWMDWLRGVPMKSFQANQSEAARQWLISGKKAAPQTD